MTTTVNESEQGKAEITKDGVQRLADSRAEKMPNSSEMQSKRQKAQQGTSLQALQSWAKIAGNWGIQTAFHYEGGTLVMTSKGWID